MKIYQFLSFIIFSFVINFTYAQDGSPSPYSFFGLGDVNFKGTVENLAMGGINSYTDSIHYNINTPASLSTIKYVNFNLAFSNNFYNISDQNAQKNLSAHNISYFSLAIPIGTKWGFAFGILPVSSSGYRNYTEDNLGVYTFEGSGGNNRLFLAGAYQLGKNFSVGLEYQYYFGYLMHENSWIPSGVITYTRENNTLDFSGSSLKLSGLFQKTLKNYHYISASVNYRLATQFDAEYNQTIRIITLTNNAEIITDSEEKPTEKTQINYPFSVDFGWGYGQKNKWYVGTEFSYSDLKDFRNVFFDPSYITYNSSYGFKLGGIFTPQHNSVLKYYKRISYKAGMFYKNNGMNINGEDISDFGITFGLGLPAIRGISNLNIGFELGQRGTLNLVREQYFNVHIGISLNDKWFIKHKIN